MKKADLFFNVLRLPVDFATLLAAGLTTYLLRTKILATFRPVLFEFNLPLVKYTYLVLTVSFIFLLAYAASGLYSMKVRMGRVEEFLRIFVASSAAIMVLIVYIFLRQELFDSRFLVLGGWFFAIVFVSVGRLLVRNLQNFFVTRRNFGTHRLMVIGSGDNADKIVRDLQNSPQSGYRIAKHLKDPELSEVLTAIGDPGVDEVFLVDSSYSADKVAGLIELCNEHHLVFKFVPNMYQTITTNIDIESINGLPLIELKHTALDGWGKVTKRIADVAGAALGLVLISPLMAVVAFAIKWETAGPVFVRLKRVSKNREFELIKFRSMINNAHALNHHLRLVRNDRPDAGPLWKLKDDPRITGVGRVIRRYRIDELPQFINVLKGDMSLVGPRPHQQDEIDKYQKHHKKVLAIKAGATGLAQVSGSSDLPFEQEVTLDTFYIENWSLLMDLKIMLKTAFKMFTDKSAV